jgi:hypothetical protein
MPHNDGGQKFAVNQASHFSCGWCKRSPARLGIEPMENETLERWQDLCQQAAKEQDHHRFLELTREIIQMLAEKERRLSQLAKAGRVVRIVNGATEP